MKNTFKVLGIGTPIIDHLLHIEPGYLHSIPGEPYGMEVVSYEELTAIIENSGSVPLKKTGGSCCNAIKGLTALGHSCGFIGKIGKDPVGEQLIADLQDLGIQPLFSFGDSPTARALCLITPDGNRTCRSFIGAGGELNGDDLTSADFQGVRHVHIEGYSLLNAGLTHRAMDYSRASGAKISFDLGSFEIVRHYNELILDLLKNYVSISFSNEEETFALTGHSPEQGCEALRDLVDIAVVMMGDKGCWVGDKFSQFHTPANRVKAIDTTGAGDLFASGFLHGILTGRPLNVCALFGSMVGSQVVQYIGAEIPQHLWNGIKQQMLR